MSPSNGHIRFQNVVCFRPKFNNYEVGLIFLPPERASSFPGDPRWAADVWHWWPVLRVRHPSSWRKFVVAVVSCQFNHLIISSDTVTLRSAAGQGAVGVFEDGTLCSLRLLLDAYFSCHSSGNPKVPFQVGEGHHAQFDVSYSRCKDRSDFMHVLSDPVLLSAMPSSNRVVT